MCPVNSRMYNRELLYILCTLSLLQKREDIEYQFWILHRVVPPPDPPIETCLKVQIKFFNIILFIEPRLDKNPFGNGFGPPGGPPGLNPMAAQFMALQHPAFLSAAQVSAASAGIPPFGLPNPAVVTSSSPNIPGRPEPQFMKGPNAASLASLEALQR